MPLNPHEVDWVLTWSTGVAHSVRKDGGWYRNYD